jgi:hypothetical protein
MGEQSGLLTRIGATESGSWCERIEKLTAFVELGVVTRKMLGTMESHNCGE